MLLTFITTFIVMCITSVHADDSLSPITLSFTEKPPYYFTHEISKEPQGFLLNKSLEIFDRAQIKYKLISLPPKRILKEIEDNKTAHCSIGWFKNSEREKFALYSEIIHRDSPMVVVINSELRSQLTNTSTLKDLEEWIFFKRGQTLNSQTFIFGTVSGFSYGEALDAIILKLGKNKITTDQSSQSPLQLLHRIAFERINMGFFDIEEYGHYINNNPRLAANLALLKMVDSPPGKERFIICSKNVGAEVIQKINKHIKK